MAEPVRDTIKRSIKETKGEPEDDAEEEADEGNPIGLVENPDDVAFQCATCDYFEDGICQNEDPKLNGKEVEGRWCCNKYEHPGMKTIVA